MHQCELLTFTGTKILSISNTFTLKKKGGCGTWQQQKAPQNYVVSPSLNARSAWHDTRLFAASRTKKSHGSNQWMQEVTEIEKSVESLPSRVRQITPPPSAQRPNRAQPAKLDTPGGNAVPYRHLVLGLWLITIMTTLRHKGLPYFAGWRVFRRLFSAWKKIKHAKKNKNKKRIVSWSVINLQ